VLSPGVHHAIHDRNFADLMKAEKAVLVVGRTDCANCGPYNEEIEQLVRKPHFKSIVFGKLTLDKPGGLELKKSQPWLADLALLPHTVLYRKGKKVDEFAAANAATLVEHIEDFLLN